MSYISFLLLCNNLSQTQQLKTTPRYLLASSSVGQKSGHGVPSLCMVTDHNTTRPKSRPRVFSSEAWGPIPRPYTLLTDIFPWDDRSEVPVSLLATRGEPLSAPTDYFYGPLHIQSQNREACMNPFHVSNLWGL